MATVYFSAASIDERGKISGGRAGDQTGLEVRTTKAYTHKLGWRIFRHPNANIAKWIGTNAKTMADNNHFGYDQSQRLTGYNAAVNAGWEPKRVTTDVEIDCSELVRTAIACALERNIPDFSTATESNVLLSLGFREITGTPLGNLQVGDILVTKTKGHTEIVSQVVADTVPQPQPAAKPNILYKVKTSGGWLPEVVNNSDYAGIEGRSIKGFMCRLSNGAAIKYRVHLTSGKWLPFVTGYNATDHNNGYAGNGTDIDAIEIKCDNYDIRYNVSTTSSTGYCGEVSDNTTSGGNSYAGIFGRPIDKVQCRIV